MIGYALEPLLGTADYKLTVPPNQYTEPDVGVAVDFGTAFSSSSVVTAVGIVGLMANDAAFAVTFQESHDGTSWVAVPDAALPATAVPGMVQVVSFPRTRRYVRADYDVNGEEGALATATVVLYQSPTIGLMYDNAGRNGSPLLVVCGPQLAALGSVQIPTPAQRTVFTNDLRGWVATVRQPVTG